MRIAITSLVLLATCASASAQIDCGWSLKGCGEPTGQTLPLPPPPPRPPPIVQEPLDKCWERMRTSSGGWTWVKVC